MRSLNHEKLVNVFYQMVLQEVVCCQTPMPTLHLLGKAGSSVIRILWDFESEAWKAKQSRTI